MINSKIKRKFSKIFSEFSDQLSETYLTKYGIDDSTKPEDRFSKILEKNSMETLAGFKKIWQLAELGSLSNSWLNLYTTSSKYSSLKEIKSLFGKADFASNITILILNENPKIYGIYCFNESRRSYVDRALLDDFSKEIMYYVPKYSIVLTNIHNDETGEKFRKFIEGSFNDLISFRTKTMIISKFYNNTLNINDLHIMSDHQVAGFSGMDQIAFHGDHIKQGLYGLHKRQDIRVHLDQIGPRIEVSGLNLHLKIGPKVRVKTPLGFQELSELIKEFH